VFRPTFSIKDILQTLHKDQFESERSENSCRSLSVAKILSHFRKPRQLRSNTCSCDFIHTTAKYQFSHCVSRSRHSIPIPPTVLSIAANMEAAGKVPVKLVKVTRVLGRTGKNQYAPHNRTVVVGGYAEESTRLTFLLLSRLSRWCDTGPSRVYGRHKPKHHPERKRTRYVGFLAKTETQ